MISQLVLAVFNHLEDKHLVMVHATKLAWNLDFDIKGKWMNGDLNVDLHTEHDGVNEVHKSPLAKDKPSLNKSLTDHNTFSVKVKGFVLVDGVKILINETWTNIYL